MAQPSVMDVTNDNIKYDFKVLLENFLIGDVLSLFFDSEYIISTYFSQIPLECCIKCC